MFTPTFVFTNTHDDPRYPDTKDDKTKLYPHVVLVKINELTGRAQVVKRVLMAVRSQWTETELQELDHTKTGTDDETGLYVASHRRQPIWPRLSWCRPCTWQQLVAYAVYCNRVLLFMGCLVDSVSVWVAYVPSHCRLGGS
jgi:hypothetical protein